MEDQKTGMNKYKNWDDWESSVNLAGLQAPLRKLLDLLLSAAHLRASLSSDEQHRLFMSLSDRVQSEIGVIMAGKSISKQDAMLQAK
jgi:hypothetical protein